MISLFVVYLKKQGLNFLVKCSMSQLYNQLTIARNQSNCLISSTYLGVTNHYCIAYDHINALKEAT